MGVMKKANRRTAALLFVGLALASCASTEKISSRDNFLEETTPSLVGPHTYYIGSQGSKNYFAQRQGLKGFIPTTTVKYLEADQSVIPVENRFERSNDTNRWVEVRKGMFLRPQ